MRAESLRRLTPEFEWTWVDTDPPLQQAARVWRTLAFRSRVGRAVNRINEEVGAGIGREPHDLIWVDKGVFLREASVQRLRNSARRLIHYTPDTAFHENRSAHFERTLGLYDLAVTTKAFEVDEYENRIGPEKVLLTTQGYDLAVHYPRNTDAERRRETLFIGLAEPDREACVATLLDNDISVRLAGRGWTRFVRRHQGNPCLIYEGDDVFGDDYASLLSRSWIGLGLLSRRFPELHTTRTFEIPACGAMLASPRTSETTTFFADSEALFFDAYSTLASRLKVLLTEPGLDSVASVASAGHRRVLASARDYDSILGAVLADQRLS